MDFSLDIFNEKQREAVKKTRGPLLVISGAGTGKTHVLTGKILHLILEKKAKPEEILALTFTEKAAQEMTQRVDESLPLGYGEIWIKTFHGFCDSILREKAFEIGLSTDFKLFSEADCWVFIKRHLTDFELDYYRPLSYPQKFLKAMQDHFSRLQDEDITPEKYLAHSKSAAQKAANDEEKENASKQMELAKIYKKYLELLIRENCMDFGSLLFFTLRLLDKRASVLADLQKRFRYILVDEFQDTNFAQNKIIGMLAEKNNDITVVGDDDQAIYKWRGASLTNIKYFQKKFPSAEKIVLNENYRSSQAILDFAYASIQKNNPNRLEASANIDKKLIKVSKKKEQLPEIHHFESLDEEADFVVQTAESFQKKGLDTAILVRTNNLANPFLEKLEDLALPFQHLASPALLRRPGVKDCMAILKVLADPWDNLAFFRFLSMPVWNMEMMEILDLVKRAKLETKSIYELLNGSNRQKMRVLIFDLIEFSREQNVSQVLMKFLTESGYLKSIEENDSKILDIALLSEKIVEFEKTHPDKKVMDFLEYAKILDEVGEKAPNEQLIDANSIKVLTVHSAKGLEFDAVLLPGMVNGKFPSVSRKDPFEIPEELIEEILPHGNHHIEEERRLFYVASTRPKERLIFTYSDFYDGKKHWKVSPFIQEIDGIDLALIKNHAAEKKSQMQQQLPIDDGIGARRNHHGLKEGSFSLLSYTQIDTFGQCPQKYQFRYLYNLQTPPSSTLNFGLSIHGALKDFYAFLKKNPPEKDDDLFPVLQKFYEKNWIPIGYETPEMHKDQKSRGEKLLRKYCINEKKEGFRIPAFIEKEFLLKIDNIVLKGAIDRIDLLPDGTYEVIDYKTGDGKNKNAEKDMQLSIYALACKEVLKIPVSRLSLYFLENIEKKSAIRTEEDLESCRAEIKKHAQGIMNSDFSPTPGFHCGFCDYRLICPVAAQVGRMV